MDKLFAALILILGMIAGCASFQHQPLELRTSIDTTFEISSNQIDAIELRPSEIQFYKGKDIVGFLMTVDTNPESKSAMDEVRQGFIEAQKGPGTPNELELPASAYGFYSAFRGYTTAFIAVEDHPEAWITVSVKDEVFDEVLSSITMK